jgi:hypothetical protein
MMSSDTALRLKSLLSEISPIIEEYTGRVCPSCTDVCCRQKHGQYLEQDVRYLAALGVALPAVDASRPPEGPCGFLGPSGCLHPRWLRPWKCTWFFCGPLLAALDDGPQRTARRLSAAMQEIMRLYDSVE